MLPRLSSAAFDATTTVVIIIACLAARKRLGNQLDSNLPLMFYTSILLYVNLLNVDLPTPAIYIGCLLALFLRFEFMGGGFSKLLQFCDLIVICSLVFNCAGSITHF